MQCRTQSPLAFWSAGGRQERLWGTGIQLPQDFCGKTMEAVAGQPIKKFNCFRILQSLYWCPPADQKARGLWVRDCNVCRTCFFLRSSWRMTQIIQVRCPTETPTTVCL